MGSNDKKCLSKGETTNDVSVYCSRFDAFLPWIWMKVPPPSELKMSSLSFHKLKPLYIGERLILQPYFEIFVCYHFEKHTYKFINSLCSSILDTLFFKSKLVDINMSIFRSTF